VEDRYGIRLYKAIRSFQVFGLDKRVASVQAFLLHIGVGCFKGVDPKRSIDDVRIVKALNLPEYNDLPVPPPRYS
jgi:hypothetical protein